MANFWSVFDHFKSCCCWNPSDARKHIFSTNNGLIYFKLITFLGTLFGHPNWYTSLQNALVMALHLFEFFPVRYIFVYPLISVVSHFKPSWALNTRKRKRDWTEEERFEFRQNTNLMTIVLRTFQVLDQKKLA